MTHVSLFSGIGGLDLAAEWAGFDTVLFCEKDPYCQKVLAKHWPGVPIIDDIRSVSRESIDGAIDVISGGFPCQPFSLAGKRGGTGDERYLWPEMLRVIHELRPRWVVAENVPGLLSIDGGLVFENVLVDLEREGYETLPLVYPAAGVGAPHKRDRVFMVAHRFGVGRREGAFERIQPEKQITEGQDSRDFDTERYDWGKNWYEVATRFCRVDDGVSARLDRIRGLGNAVVPLQARTAFQRLCGMKVINSYRPGAAGEG